MLGKILKLFVLLTGLGMVAVAAVFYFGHAQFLPKWTKVGDVYSGVKSTAEGGLTFTKIDSTDFIGSTIPDSGNVILSVGDSTGNIETWRGYFSRQEAPGREVAVKFIKSSDTLITVIRTQPFKYDRYWDIIILALRFLITISYLGVGFWAFLKRPDSGAVRALALFCFAMAGFVMGAVTMGQDYYVANAKPLTETIRNSMGNFVIFFGAFWLNLQFLFPYPHPLMKKHPVLVYLLCYLPIPLCSVGMNFIGGGYWLIILLSMIFLQIATGFLILRNTRMGATEPIHQRQIRLVMTGSGIGMSGLLLLFLLAVAAAVFDLEFLNTILISIIVIIVFLGLLVIPVTFALAIGRHGLLEIEGRLRRGTRFAVTTLALLAAFYLVLYSVSNLALDFLGPEQKTPTLILAVLLAAGFTPTQRKIRNIMERRIYPERVRLRAMLSDFLQSSLAIPDKEVFWKELEGRLGTALGISVVCPVLLLSRENKLVLWDGTTTPFATDSGFIEQLRRRGNHPVLRDEISEGQRLELSAEESEWFERNQIALILPLNARNSLNGFLGLGYKTGEKDFEPADFELLQSLAYQISFAVENVMLLEESVAKKRLDTEMAIARQVQERMLPRELPAIKGLQLSARSLFCTEVAGDYYDIIILDENRTLFAIGDVSGKGAGAAMLMSNVQAALRTAAGIGGETRLEDIITRLNDLIYHNSQPDQFVTLFAAMYDNGKVSLEFINAGHNPPLLVRGDGEAIQLQEGGILLGAVPGMTYERGEVSIHSGDVICLYTDGVTEAWNNHNEMYGEERLKLFLTSHSELSAEEILRGLAEDVVGFSEGRPFGDDYTVLVAKGQ